MPLVNVRLIEGVFTPEQKREMIHHSAPRLWWKSKARTCVRLRG